MTKNATKPLFAALVLSTAALAGCVTAEDEAPAPVPGDLADVTPAPSAPKHCTVAAVATREGEPTPEAAEPSEVRCFDTFAESIAVATKGNVRLAPDATPEALDELAPDQAAAVGTFIVAIEYLGLYWDGYWGSLTITSDVTCNQGYKIEVRDLFRVWSTNGWTTDNSIGSARTYNGCLHGYHFDYPSWGGAVIDCPSNPEWNCYYTMGAMNDRTSSLRWSNF